MSRVANRIIPISAAEPSKSNGRALRPTDAPLTLDEAARTEWARLLKEAGPFTQRDRNALASNSAAWSRWVEAEKQVAALGLVVKSAAGLPVPNPYLAIAAAAVRQMVSLGKSLGIARAKR